MRTRGTATPAAAKTQQSTVWRAAAKTARLLPSGCHRGYSLPYIIVLHSPKRARAACAAPKINRPSVSNIYRVQPRCFSSLLYDLLLLILTITFSLSLLWLRIRYFRFFSSVQAVFLNDPWSDPNSRETVTSFIFSPATERGPLLPASTNSSTFAIEIYHSITVETILKK